MHCARLFNRGDNHRGSIGPQVRWIAMEWDVEPACEPTVSPTVGLSRGTLAFGDERQQARLPYRLAGLKFHFPK